MIIEVLVPILVLVGGIILIAFFASHFGAMSFDSCQMLNYFENSLNSLKYLSQDDLYQITFPVYPATLTLKCEKTSGNICETVWVSVNYRNSCSKTFALNRMYCIQNCNDNTKNGYFICDKVINIYLNNGALIFICSKE